MLFPRPDVERSIARLVGIDVAAQPGRVLVVGEGIDVVALERVAKEVAGDAPPGPVTQPRSTSSTTLLAQLPADRRSLPLAVSVGRLAPVKGMATLVSTWLADPALRRRCNLLVIGGDLDDPSPEEAAELVPDAATAVAADEAGGAGAAARRAPPQRHDDDVAGRRPAGHARHRRTRRRLRVRQPQGGVRHRHPRGDGGGAGRRGPGRRRPRDLRRGRRHRRPHRHRRTARPSPRHRPGPRPRGVARGRAARPPSRAVVRERFGIDTMAAALGEVYAAGGVGARRGPGRTATP